VNQDLLKEIAKAHDDGRRLYILTYNMDAQSGMIWNMGKIAKGGHPGALELFRNVMLASGSVPAIFPPMIIEVEVKGIKFDEMHVDGGVGAQVFFYGLTLNVKKRT